VEIRRFGVGHRRPDGPDGTTGVASQVIHADARGLVAELAFARRATMDLHSSPNSAWLVIVEGGGWVQVGDERARVAAGEAVHWPAGVGRAAWTELSEMRAFVVEFAGVDDAAARGILEGRALELTAGGAATGTDGPGDGAAPVASGEGSLATGEGAPANALADAKTAAEGEPL
jgi:quercetin dioxygenase-like cupin family protein